MKFANLARLAPALALFSCRAPKAIIIEQAPVLKKEAVAETLIPEPNIPALPDDGLRNPDFLELPSDKEFRATTPIIPKPGATPGAVTVRPPTDPPSRPKPKEPEKEPEKKPGKTPEP